MNVPICACKGVAFVKYWVIKEADWSCSTMKYKRNKVFSLKYRHAFYFCQLSPKFLPLGTLMPTDQTWSHATPGDGCPGDERSGSSFYTDCRHFCVCCCSVTRSCILKHWTWLNKYCHSKSNSVCKILCLWGTNVRGFHIILHPHECIYNHLFNIYFNYPNYTIKEIRPPKTRNIFATHKQWPPWIKMNPHYTRSLYLELNEIVTSSSITQI